MDKICFTYDSENALKWISASGYPPTSSALLRGCYSGRPKSTHCSKVDPNHALAGVWCILTVQATLPSDIFSHAKKCTIKIHAKYKQNNATYRPDLLRSPRGVPSLGEANKSGLYVALFYMYLACKLKLHLFA